MSPFLNSWLLPEEATSGEQVTSCKEPDSQQRSKLRGLQGQHSSSWGLYLHIKGAQKLSDKYLSIKKKKRKSFSGTQTSKLKFFPFSYLQSPLQSAAQQNILTHMHSFVLCSQNTPVPSRQKWRQSTVANYPS